VQDSPRILHWLAAIRAPFALLPAEDAVRKDVLALEASFDEVGEHVVRYAYSTTLDDHESVIRYWTLDSTPLQRGFVRSAFSVLRFIFRRKLWMSRRSVARSRQKIEAGLDVLDGRIAAGQKYLVGEQLSAADITAAALLAPLVCPDEHPIYGSARYRAGVAPLTVQWQERPAFRWVRQMYREHRGAWPNAERIRGALS